MVSTWKPGSEHREVNDMVSVGPTKGVTLGPQPETNVKMWKKKVIIPQTMVIQCEQKNIPQSSPFLQIGGMVFPGYHAQWVVKMAVFYPH